MSGWLVSLTYEASGQVPILEALFASWQVESEDALRDVARLDAIGSRIVPRIVAPLSESMLRGLHLEPGATARLRPGEPPLF